MFSTHVRPDLVLRILTERHAATAFALVDQDRKYLREWLPWVDASHSSDDTLAFIRSSREQLAAESGFSAGLWHAGEFAGVIGMHKIDRLNRKGEIGYWLGEAHQGKGLMTDACRAVVTCALEELELNRVEILCAIGNHKSCAIPRRLGFTQEGTLREAELVNDRYHDLHLFSMLKRDWKK
jgi:ribosomal-protein-serine acetyltransferase